MFAASEGGRFRREESNFAVVTLSITIVEQCERSMPVIGAANL
jgi:hypothetical protein